MYRLGRYNGMGCLYRGKVLTDCWMNLISRGEVFEIVSRYADGSTYGYVDNHNNKLFWNMTRGVHFMRSGYKIDRNYWNILRELQGK